MAKKTARLPKIIQRELKWKTSEKRQYDHRPGNPNLYAALVRTPVYMDAEDLLFLKAYARMVETTVSRVVVGLIRTFKKQAASKVRKTQQESA